MKITESFIENILKYHYLKEFQDIYDKSYLL